MLVVFINLSHISYLKSMSISLKKSQEGISVQWSASHLINNLTIHRSSQLQSSTTYGVAHKSGFAMVTQIISYKIIK